METILNSMVNNINSIAVVVLLISFLISYYTLPSIIDLVNSKNLMDEPGERSSHSKKIPTLGGVAIFISMAISLTLLSVVFKNNVNFSIVFPLLASLIVLFFLGLKDDLMDLSPLKKIVGQLIAAFIIILLTDIRIIEFYGILGIAELNYISSILITVFIYVLVINAFNLIDGVDGLAGSVAVFSSLTFGLYFLLNGYNTFVLISFSLVGALLAFLRFNLSSKKKIFMGDTGSMVVGFLLAFQALSFLSMNLHVDSIVKINNAPLFVIAILSFPLIDTARVFFIRIKLKKSPFSADRNHIHHKLLDMGLSHKQVTLSVVFYSVFITVFAYHIDIDSFFSLNSTKTVLLSLSLPLYIKKESIKNFLKNKSFILKKYKKILE